MRQVSLKDSDRSNLTKSLVEVEKVTSDLSLHCRDGTVHSHQALLAWGSSYLRRLLMSQHVLEEGGRRKEQASLHLPDHRAKVVVALTTFLTTGELVIREGRGFREEFNQVWEELRVDRVGLKDVTLSGGDKQVKKRGRPSLKPETPLPSTTPFKTPQMPIVRSTSSLKNIQNPIQLFATPSKVPKKTSSPSSVQAQPMPAPTPSKSSNPSKNPKPTIPPKTPTGKRTPSTQHPAPLKTTPVPPAPGPPSSPQPTTPSLPPLLQNNWLTITSERTGLPAITERFLGNKEVSVTISGGPAAKDDDVPKIVGMVEGKSGSNSVSIIKKSVTEKKPEKVQPAKAPYLSRTIGSRISLRNNRFKQKRTKQTTKLVNKAKLAINNKEVGPKRKSARNSSATFATYNEDVIENKVFEEARSDELKEKILKSKATVSIPLMKVVKSKQIAKTTPKPKKPYKKTPKAQGNKNKISINTNGTKVKNTPVTKTLMSKTPVSLPKSTKEITVSVAKPDNTEKVSSSSSEILLSTPTVSITRTVEAAGSVEASVSHSSTPLPSPIVSITRSSEITSNTPSMDSDLPPSSVSITKSADSISPNSTASLTNKPTDTSQVPPASTSPELDPITCYICNQTKDKEQRDLNLRNVFYVRSHISKCLYSAGKLFRAIPPGKDNIAADGVSPSDEFGLKGGFWYNCEVEDCWLAQKGKVAGQVCYKVFAIHMASQHGALEMVMLEDGDSAREIVERLMDYEEKKKIDFTNSTNLDYSFKTEKVLDATLEEASEEKTELVTKSAKKSKTPTLGHDGEHSCPLCSTKDGKKLSFKDISRLKEHYAKCLYKESKLMQFVPPGPENSDETGKPKDETSPMYRCEVKGCYLQRKKSSKGQVNFKTYALHMATDHGVLERVLQTKPNLQQVLEGIVTAELNRPDMVRCRFSQCSGVRFKTDNVREVKLHYATSHFARWFRLNSDTEMAQAGFTKSGGRSVCGKCTSLAGGKAVYIQAETSAVRGHLVVKHDLLAEVLVEAEQEGVTEATGVIEDLYSDKLKTNSNTVPQTKTSTVPQTKGSAFPQTDSLAQVYMDTLDSTSEGQLNFDFMDKISL